MRLSERLKAELSSNGVSSMQFAYFMAGTMPTAIDTAPYYIDDLVTAGCTVLGKAFIPYVAGPGNVCSMIPLGNVVVPDATGTCSFIAYADSDLTDQANVWMLISVPTTGLFGMTTTDFQLGVPVDIGDLWAEVM